VGWVWPEKKIERKAGGKLGLAEWAGVASAAGLLGRSGRHALSFFLKQKLKIHFGASNKIEKMQMRYRWIRYEKYFNMRQNFKQKYKPFKIEI
jgi:hypothetical protein